MFEAVIYDASMRKEWDRLALTRGTVYHTIGFRDVLRASFGYACAYYALFDRENNIQAILPLVISRNLGWKLAGVSLPFVNHLDICACNEEAQKAAIHHARSLQREAGLDYVELRLKDQDIDAAGWSVQQQNVTFTLPLDPDEGKVLASAGAGCRNHVRKVYRNDWFAVSYDVGHLEAFYQVYATRMKQLGSPAPRMAFFERILAELPEQACLQTVLDKQTGRVAGGMLLLASPGDATLYYPYGANLVEYNHRYLNSFMYWEAVRLGIRLGLRFLDLGRSPVGSGTYLYKQQWGAIPQPLKYMTYTGRTGTTGAPDRENFDLLVALWKRMPRFLTDPVGARVIKYLLP